MLLVTKVVNKRTHSFDISIGRDSEWGNPFPMKNKSQEERDIVCDEFEKYYAEKEMWRNIWQLKNKTLGCYCKPLRCHGDFLAKEADDSFEIHSGGAEGADSIFDEYAPKEAIIYHHSFKGHKISPSVKGEVILHTYEELMFLKDKYSECCNMLKKRESDNLYIQQLCLRNWFQVKNSNFIIAIVKNINDQENCICEGGTGYAVMYAKMLKKPILVFNQKDNIWYSSNLGRGLVEAKKQSPTWEMAKFKNIAGIGTREINSYGINAIKNFLNGGIKK